ncbi:patatin-like phospholipase family protein [Nocardia uniformis]|uniref:Patatin-like phospholipase family protein n=1 Tax=Nocardia uniformis TaxID=53432 RepID=A0A849C2A0_9NOCA|nr:patatin-like phospholipase family protein [Nocardia uniformis]NNH70560.1 patatin-like phospholipase family protein [Nocardia uniformis]
MVGKTVDRTSNETIRRSIVLGGGSIYGTAWMAGLAAELRRRGIDLGAADSIVGTSAGASVGAMLATGRDLDSLANSPFPADVKVSHPPRKPELLAAVFAVLSDRNADREVARRKVGQLAMAEEPARPEHIEPTEWFIGGNAWPDHRLKVIVVDAESGERRIWNSDSGVALTTATVASRALPGAFPPVVVDNRYYIDGGVWSATNADIAADADVVLVIEPLAHQWPREPLRAELAGVPADAVVHFGPDAATIDVFNASAANPDVFACWPEAFRAGIRQADALAEQLARSAWLSPRS